MPPVALLDAACEGRVGTVIDIKQDGATKMHRVRFDVPVVVKGVGSVADDVWPTRFAKNRKLGRPPRPATRND